MLVTKTDISITCERPKISAPVSSTEPTPSESGRAAAANEPKTASRISSTIGKPADSALARSSLERSCIAGPERALADEVRRDARARAVRDGEPLAQVDGDRGGVVLVDLGHQRHEHRRPAAACSAPARARPGRATRRRPAPRRRPTRSTAARSCARDAPSCGTSTAASWARWTPGKPASAESTTADCEPGTPKPPLERSSDWRAANGTAASRITAQAIRTVRLWRRRKASRRNMVVCIGSGVLAGWPANLSGGDLDGPPHRRAVNRADEAVGPRLGERDRPGRREGGPRVGVEQPVARKPWPAPSCVSSPGSEA